MSQHDCHGCVNTSGQNVTSRRNVPVREMDALLHKKMHRNTRHIIHILTKCRRLGSPKCNGPKCHLVTNHHTVTVKMFIFWVNIHPSTKSRNVTQRSNITAVG